MHFLVLLSVLVACATGKCYNRLYSSKYLQGSPNLDIGQSNILYIYICNIIKDNLLNSGFEYHRARFSLLSLDDTLNRIWAQKFRAPKTGLCVTPALDHAEYLVGVFPQTNWLTLVVDRSRLSSNFMRWTWTAVTSPLLGKRADVYN
jgi:hypothetical protein